MGNCIQHPAIQEESFMTSHGKARKPPSFDAKSVETHATEVHQTEEGEVRTLSPTDKDSASSSGKSSVTCDPNVDSDQSNPGEESAPRAPEEESKTPDVQADPSSDAASVAAPVAEHVEKEEPISKDAAPAPVAITSIEENGTDKEKPVVANHGRTLKKVLLAVCTLAAAATAGSIVVTQMAIKGGSDGALIPIPLPLAAQDVDANVSPRSSFWEEIQEREDERLQYPHKIMDQHVRAILNESESDMPSSPSSSGCSWNTQWESESNDVTSSVYCNLYGIVQEWTTSIRNRTVTYLE